MSEASIKSRTLNRNIVTRLITTHDIAREAGVSRTTVSYVLSDRAGISVSPKTRKRVLATARKLGYVPNSAAEMLVTGRSRSIGLVLSRPELISVDGFIPIMIYGLNEVCRERGYRLSMEAVHDPPGADDYLDLAKSKRIDSMIVINPTQGGCRLAKGNRIEVPGLGLGVFRTPAGKRNCNTGKSSQLPSYEPLDIARTPTDCPHWSCLA